MSLLGPHNPGVELGWILTIGVVIYAGAGFLGYMALNWVLKIRRRRTQSKYKEVKHGT